MLRLLYINSTCSETFSYQSLYIIQPTLSLSLKRYMTMLTFSSMPDLFAYNVSQSISPYGILESLYASTNQCVHLVKFAVVPVQGSKPFSVPYIHLCFSTQIRAMRYLNLSILRHFPKKGRGWVIPISISFFCVFRVPNLPDSVHKSRYENT